MVSGPCLNANKGALMPSPRVPDAVRRIFTESFTARDVAEPLASFDAEASAREVRAFMTHADFDVIGIRKEGQVIGFVEQASLDAGACGQYLRPFDEAAILNDATPLLRVLSQLDGSPFLFVRSLGIVGGIVTRADMQKAPVRMWLFGVVTLIELRFGELIELHCPGDSWKANLSEGRLQKARALLEERSRRNQKLQLLDCLQFADKAQIIARNEAVRKLTVFASRSQTEEAAKRLEQLRNNLAHAQDILATDWRTIIQLCEFIAHHVT
jgi:hypothetical protein